MKAEPEVRKFLVDDYTQLVLDKIGAGYSCHLATFLFPKIQLPASALLAEMRGQVQRVYSTLVTRVHRHPANASADELPILIGAFDLPVFKRNKTSTPEAMFNGGLHFHALILMPQRSRLKQSLQYHLAEYDDMYTGSGKLIQTIDVRPVVDSHRRVVDYLFKTIKRGRLSYDDGVLILPRSKGELAGTFYRPKLVA